LDLSRRNWWKAGEDCIMSALPNIIRAIKSRRMRLAVHVACMGELRSAYNILVGTPEGKRPLEDLDIH